MGKDCLCKLSQRDLVLANICREVRVLEEDVADLRKVSVNGAS